MNAEVGIKLLEMRLELLKIALAVSPGQPSLNEILQTAQALNNFLVSGANHQTSIMYPVGHA